MQYNPIDTWRNYNVISTLKWRFDVSLRHVPAGILQWNVSQYRLAP